LGYLPLHIKALDEGSKVPMKVPVLTITNTRDEFFWLVNYLETVLSAELWKASTNATIAHHYRKVCEQWAVKTCSDMSHLDFQCHDFSFRGMAGLQDTMQAGAGHLLSLKVPTAFRHCSTPVITTPLVRTILSARAFRPPSIA
jgi:nicotinamide phosphoribosyltransferase